MPFYYSSCLPKNITEQDKRDLCSSFECDIDTIKGYLTEIANTYLLVAYRIYEINRNRSYKGKYKNIVEACQSELGFKKSTTYNMINIVEEFGKPDTSGFITYSSLFGVEKFSYSQLCEMLSLSDKQRLKVTPEMTVKEIREIKKEEKVISEKSVINVPEPEPAFEPGRIFYPEPESSIEVVSDPEPEPVLDDDSFQTSGICYDLDFHAFDFVCSHCKYMIDVDIYEGSEDDYSWSDESKSMKYCPCCGYMIVSKSVYYHDSKYDKE